MNNIYAQEQEKRNRPIKVAFYARVSTEHEVQTYALGNQIQWYDDLATKHQNWIVVDKYIDEGITGTQTTKRPAFLKMIEDAKRGKFNLIVTREVSRFARNVVDCLTTARELKANNVEIYFVQEEIWTMENKGEIELTYRAMFAQDESRKMSDRILAGLEMSKKNGVIFGSGNILGYDKVNGMYIINKEQADTVKIIFDMYANGKGIAMIRDKLVERKRKNSSGNYSWDTGKINRILKNTTYKGVLTYNQSYRNNYLEQKVIKNKDKSKLMHVKGNYEPIISEEQFDYCQRLLESRIHKRTFIKDGEVQLKTVNSNKADNVWSRKIKCKCGASMRRDKWNLRADGKRPYGFKCYNQLNKGADKLKLTDAGYCNLHAISSWEFDLMGIMIFSRLWRSKSILDYSASQLIKDNSIKKEDNDKKCDNLRVEIKDKERKLDRILRLRVDGEINSEEYKTLKGKLSNEKEELEQRLDMLLANVCGVNDNLITQEDAVKYLKACVSSNVEELNEILIDRFVTRIQVVSESKFVWYMSVRENTETPKETTFTIPFNTAKSFRIKHNNTLHKNKYEEIRVKVVY